MRFERFESNRKNHFFEEILFRKINSLTFAPLLTFNNFK